MEQSELDKIDCKIIKDKTLSRHDALYKLILIGDTCVGKSSLLMRLTENEFREEYEVTVGVEFGAFLMQIDDKIIKLQIWDTAGQESFKSLNKIFYRGSHCVFLVYDITREETFHNVEDWLEGVKMNTSNDCMTYLVGNQIDNEDSRVVSIDKANTYAKEAGINHVCETSAKTGERVEEIFINAAKMLYIKNKHAMEEKEKEPVGTQLRRATRGSSREETSKPKKAGCQC